jgi:diadenylate cyclase
MVGLGAWLETGTPLDAELTAPLLNTLFHPGTQLHDMGVIIRNGRVSAAACQFPLAESDEVDVSLGSRHRAALGLARETDAIILVVSEQTGRISVAHEGQLSVGLDVEALRELLRAALAPEKKQRRRSWRRSSGSEGA